MIHEGDRAPDFSGISTDGKRISLADYVGKKPLILYFYPKDDTPGCTKEACTFRDLAGEIAAAGGAVVGVSMDTRESHERFTQKHGLNFPLLADESGTIAGAYGTARLGGLLGAWIPARRVTFVIDREGVVRRVIASELSMDRHTDGAIEALRTLSSAPPRA